MVHECVPAAHYLLSTSWWSVWISLFTPQAAAIVPLPREMKSKPIFLGLRGGDQDTGTERVGEPLSSIPVLVRGDWWPRLGFLGFPQ